MLRFEAFKQNFPVQKKRFIVRTIKSQAEITGMAPTITRRDTFTENSAPSTSLVPRMEAL